MPRRKKPREATKQVLEALAEILVDQVEPETKEVQLPVLNCSHGCIQKAMASQIILEALASTVWEPAEYKHNGYEYLVTDIVLVELTKGRQTFGVTIQAVNNPREEKEDILLHKFLTNYIPVRQINVKYYQS